MATALLLTACTACAADHQDGAARAAAATTSNCLAAGDGALQARLRGALNVDLNWSDAEMTCEGGTRPDGKGLRVSIAGPLPHQQPQSAAQQLRFVFGIDLKDAASGPAQALPTNLTVIVEGQKQLFATRGSQRCAVETLERVPLLAANGRQEHVHVRGYCTGPAIDVGSGESLLVATFEFTARAAVEDLQ
jgi:hypothetical protein